MSESSVTTKSEWICDARAHVDQNDQVELGKAASVQRLAIIDQGESADDRKAVKKQIRAPGWKVERLYRQAEQRAPRNPLAPTVSLDRRVARELDNRLRLKPCERAAKPARQ